MVITIWTWILIILLLGAAFGLFKANLPQFALLALVPAALLGVNLFVHLTDTTWGIFWVIWFIALFISILLSGTLGMVAASVITIAAIVLMFVGPELVSVRATTQAQELRLALPNDTIKTVDYHDNGSTPGASPDAPLVGSAAVNDTFATATLPGNGTVHSWSELVQRFDRASDVQKAEYASTFDTSAHLFGGTWSEVTPKLLAAEKAGVDTRVIQVVNSTVTDDQARSLIREDAGAAAASLPIVRVNGAVVTTNGGVGVKSVVNHWANNRSVVQTVLTVPQNIKQIKPEQASANVQAASVAVDVAGPCSNIDTGVVEQPKPQPKAPVKQTPTTPPGSGTATPTPTQTTSTPTPTPTETTATPTPTPTETTATPTPTPTQTTSTPTPTPTETTATPTPTPTETTPTPECTYLPPGNGESPTSDKCLAAKDPKDSLPGPTGKPTAPAPTDPVETTQPVESEPAQPTTLPSSTATQVAPGATIPATTIPIPSSDPAVAPTAGTGIGDPDAATSVVTSQATLSPEQATANQQAAQAVADQAAADAAAQAAQQAAADAAAQQAAQDAQAKAVADAAAQKTAADAAAKQAADAIAAQQAADAKATATLNEAAQAKAIETAKATAPAPSAPAESVIPTGTAGASFAFPLLLCGALFRTKKSPAGKRH
jgi:hypothetical protein